MWWNCFDKDFNNIMAGYHIGCWRVLLQRDSLDIYLTKFSESVIFEMQILRGSSFLKRSRFHPDFTNAAKNRENVFCFWDNCIWTGIVSLSLLRTGYLSLAANMLANNRKIWHITNRDFLQFSCVHSDQ